MSDVISFADFLKQSNYIFTGFESTVGIESNGKYALYKGRTLSRYISNYKDGQNQKLRDDICNYFLNKIRYCLYPKKRFQLNNNIDVESVDVFSDKCVTLIFQLLGINFAFLRINSDNKNDDFISMQESKLERLFEIIVSLFKSAEACVFYVGDNSKIDNKEIRKCIIPKKELRKEVNLYYMRIRWDLLFKSPDNLMKIYPLFRPEEYVKFVEYSTYAYEQLKNLMIDSTYNLRKDETYNKLENSFNNSCKALKKIVNGILKIYSADSIEDVNKMMCRRFEGKSEIEYSIDYSRTKKIKKSVFFKNPPEEWKKICIQLWLKSYSSFRLVPEEDSIFVIKQFLSCVYYSEKMLEKALTLIGNVCLKLWQCKDFKKSNINDIDDTIYEFTEELNTVYFFLVTKTNSGENHLLGLKDDWYEKYIEDDEW